MTSLTPLPTTVHHTTTRLTHREAHTQLSTFLARAENEAAYRPDSTLSERGPVSASASGTPNLTLQHLKRILLGMEGKRVVAEPVSQAAEDEDNNEDEDPVATRGQNVWEDQATDRTVKRRRKQIEDVNPEDDGPGIANADIAKEDGWQEKDDYELAQADDEVDVVNADRNPGGDVEQPEDEEQGRQMETVEVEGNEKHNHAGGGETNSKKRDRAAEQGVVVDKEERKRLKKARRQEEKKAKAEKRSRNDD